MAFSRRNFLNFFTSSVFFSLLISSKTEAKKNDLLSSEKDNEEPVSSVKQFQALGNGIKDDTKSFEIATQTHPEGVYVPAGTYLVNESLKGKFWGPGKLIFTKQSVPVSLCNPAQDFKNIFFGFDSGTIFDSNSSEGQIVSIGPGTCRNVMTGNNIVAIGSGVLSGDTLQDKLTSNLPCNGNELVGIGVNALKKGIDISNCIGIGRDALNENKHGKYNIGIGSSALQQLHTGNGNVALGRAAGMRAGIQANNNGNRETYKKINGLTLIGTNAGREITQGSYNTYIGYGTGRGVTSKLNSFTGTSTGNNNTALGASALASIENANNNLMLGGGAGRDLKSGSGNVFLGFRAGASLSDCNNKLIITNDESFEFISGAMNGALDKENIITIDANIVPVKDSVRNLGSAQRRWSQAYLSTSSISLSDQNAKTDIEDINGKERLVAIKLKGLIKKYKFKQAVAEKSDKARWHFGIVAQEVAAAFKEYGLNPHDYGMFCYDSWDDVYEPVFSEREVTDENDGTSKKERYQTDEREISVPAGEVYGIRYDELLCFIIAAL
ncbi:tail fiber domain-containing protein [Escherichia coli]|nr:tail fiber domain-containing protein [Escherichia coli]